LAQYLDTPACSEHVAMETIRRVQQRLLRSRRLPAVGIGLTLLILAGIIALGALQLRQKIRAQIVSRDADILNGVAQMVQVTQEADKELGGQIENLADQFAVALQLSQLNQFNGVIATRVFDTNGQFATALPAHVAPARLPAEELSELQQLRPVSRFHAEAQLPAVFLPGTTALARPSQIAPLLEVLIPLHRQDQSALLGVVQFLIDGRNVAVQFETLDRNLALEAALAFGAGSLIIVTALSWAFRRLQRASRLLMDRTNRLLRANEELALSAKTSAVGAITAHLVHGLSSPLSGLENLVANLGRDEVPETEWQDALTSARRVQNLIGEIVRVLGEEQSMDHYEVSLPELAGLLGQKSQAAAASAGVHLQTSVQAEGLLPNREANLVLLILENLLKNAIQATPRGGSVRLNILPAGSMVDFEVHDQGPGVPPELQPKLFTPCRSTKRGGHGIGLAICKQLANHLGAALELRSNSAQGAAFALRLPRSRFSGQMKLDPEGQVR